MTDQSLITIPSKPQSVISFTAEVANLDLEASVAAAVANLGEKFQPPMDSRVFTLRLYFLCRNSCFTAP